MTDGNRTSVVRNGVTYPYTAAWPNDQFDRGEGYVLAGYDQDGNPASVDDQGAPNNAYAYSLSYDEEGRLRSVSGRFSGSYNYDGDGRRVVRADSQGAYRFVYDGDQVVEVLDVANSVREYRTPGVGFVRSGAQRYELDSALGSNLDTRDASGSLTGLTEYDGYGKEVYRDVNQDRGDFRFAGAKGYMNDDATGWQQLGARLYLPAIGRFLTQDPIGQEGGLNLYAYCGNSPLSKVDPSGRQARNLTDDWFVSHDYNPLGTYGRTPHTPPNYSLSRWIDEASFIANPPLFYWMTGGGTMLERNAWFYQNVKTGGPMDFKHYERQTIFPFDAHYQELVDYGNFNFGVIGRSLGYSKEYLMWAAGYAARRGNGGKSYTGSVEYPNFGDQIRDNFFIQMGVQYYDKRNGGGH